MATELDGLLTRTEAKIAKLRDELRIEERVRERILEECGNHRPRVRMNPEAAGETLPAGSGGARPVDSVIEGSLVSRIIGVLEAVGRPMKAKEISARVKEQGFATTAKAGLKGAVASQLSRGFKTGRFIRKGRGRYALKSDFPEETT